MLPTYPAVLRDNQLEWTGDTPGSLTQHQAVRVHVTLLDAVAGPEKAASQGARMAAALEKLAAMEGLKGIEDPATWEREIRADRPLPDRGE